MNMWETRNARDPEPWPSGMEWLGNRSLTRVLSPSVGSLEEPRSGRTAYVR
jgi:hypothetical protein